MRTLVARNPTPAERRLLAAKRNDDEALAEALKSLLRRTGRRMRPPTPPRPPVAANLEIVAHTLCLSEAETAVLIDENGL